MIVLEEHLLQSVVAAVLDIRTKPQTAEQQFHLHVSTSTSQAAGITSVVLISDGTFTHPVQL